MAAAGDLGRRVPEGNLMSGQIVLTGRSKDTITLLDGENVPPQPIEDELCRSPLLDNVMLVGQDRRTLGALVCLRTEELERRMQVRPALAFSTRMPASVECVPCDWSCMCARSDIAISTQIVRP